MQDNLKKKYDITDEDLKRAVDQINFGKVACSGAVLVALIDLLCNGDISKSDGRAVEITAKRTAGLSYPLPSPKGIK